MFGKKNKPFFVAEISSNHNGIFLNAKKLIRDAKNFGADAVKLQTYTPKSMTVNSNKKYFKIQKGLWKDFNLWNLYKKAQTPYNWHKKLFNYGKKNGIEVFSTPFDENAVDFLEKLKCPFYKISSFEMGDLPLIKKISLTKKPIIISTGMSSLNEIDKTFFAAKKFGIKKIALLYCVSNYPSKPSDFNLNNISIMKKRYGCEIGFSDHSNDFRIASAAVNIGATIIEKHISLKKVKALDYEFSIYGNQIKDFKNKINDIDFAKNNKKFYKSILGKKNFFRNKSENNSKKFKRSIFVVKNIKKGDYFSEKNIRRIRPGFGVSPIFFHKIIGQKSKVNIQKNEPFTQNLLKKNKINLMS
jgi:pseudaminic acid synthase